MTGIRHIGIRAVAALAVLATIGLSQPGMAADFSTESEDWHGLRDFMEIAEGQSAEVRETDRLEWSEVDSDDVIVFVYPNQGLDVASISSFVVDGGRILLADDFGMSDGLLERLDVERMQPESGELPHSSFVDDDPGWPVFRAVGRHPLLEGVDEVVANHPAVFHNAGGAVIRYDDRGGLVYDMMLGDGRAVVVADPAIFINAMLPAGDNRQFAANAFSYLCHGVEECRVWLLVGDFETEGAYGESDDALFGDDLGDRIDSFNEGLRDALKELPGTELLYFIGLFLAIGTVAYLAVVLPWRRSRRLSKYIERHRDEISPPLTEFDWNVERFSNPDGRINYTLPVAILNESFQEFFLGAFELWPSGVDDRPPPDILARRFDERFSRGLSPEERQQRSREVEELLRELEAVPSRHDVFLESDKHIGPRTMARLHRRILRVLGWMGLQEAYERRTREINVRNPRRR